MLICEAKGMSREEARGLADRLVADPQRALDTFAREEFGLNPDELGSPWAAAGISFLAFALGTAPLSLFVMAAGKRGIAFSACVTGVALHSLGAILSLFVGRCAWYGRARMLLISAGARLATYSIGMVSGVGVR